MFLFFAYFDNNQPFHAHPSRLSARIVVNFRETGSIQRKDATRDEHECTRFTGWMMIGGRGDKRKRKRERERETQEAEAHLTPCGVSLTLGSSATNWISSLTRVWSLSNRWEPEHPSCIKHPRHPVHPHPHRARSGPPLAAFLFRYVPLSLIRRSLPSFEYALPFSFSSFPFLFFSLIFSPRALPSFLLI